MLGPDRPSFVLYPAPKKAPSAGQAVDPKIAARQFVARVGGLENARKALAMLAILSRAA
jgi:hypothetical protein